MPTPTGSSSGSGPTPPRIGRAGGRLDVTAAQLAGQPATGRYEAGGAAAGRPGTIWILPGAFPGGQPVEARLEFRLTLPGAINDRVATVGRSVRLGSAIPTLSWIRGDGWQSTPATHLNAEAAASEVADWDVSVTMPPSYTRWQAVRNDRRTRPTRLPLPPPHASWPGP